MDPAARRSRSGVLGLSLLRDSRHGRATQDPVLRWSFVTLGLVTLLSGLATMLHEISR